MAVHGYVGRFGGDIGLIERDASTLVIRPGPAAHNPTYLTRSADGRFIYAVLSGAGNDGEGEVAAFAVEADGLRSLGSQPTGGRVPCHLSLDPSGRYVLCANYASGSISVHAIAADGSLGDRTALVQHCGRGPNERRQEGLHAHMVASEPSGKFVLAVDLGTDAVYRYRLLSGLLEQVDAVTTAPGAGPRHLAFHPSNPVAYVANELDSTVSVLDLAAFSVGDTVSTLRQGDRSVSFPSAIRVSDDGRFCYVANRGPDTIAVLSLSADGTKMQLVTTISCGGEQPWDFILSGEHLYIANRQSNSVSMFWFRPETGVPEPVGPPAATSGPVCLLWS